MIRSLFIFLILVSSSAAYGSDIFEKVPTATLEFNGEKQISVVGSFCWHFSSGGHACADTALASPKESLNVSKNPILVLTMPNQKVLKHIQYMLVPVTDDLAMENDNFSERVFWEASSRNISELKIVEKLELDLDLKPGLYVLNIMAWWKNHDDASHGFLLNVAP